MSIKYLESNKLYTAVLQAMQPADVVLDIGCGIVPQRYVVPERIFVVSHMTNIWMS